MTVLYDSPVLGQHRAGTVGDPFLSITESKSIVNSKALLTEIPDSYNKVTVSGLGVSWSEITYGTDPTANQFAVDYINGVVYFHSSRNDQTLSFTYKGTGVLYFPADRIWTSETDNNVTETLGDIITAGETALNNIDTLNTTITNAETATTNANNAADSLVHLGEYSAITAYVIRNIVSYNGSSYMCIISSTGNLPTNATYWQLVGEKGDDTDWADIQNKPSTFTPSAHKTSHTTGQSDALSPSDIGAAPLNSPGLTGTPTSPTALADTNTTQIATTAFVVGQAGSASPQMDGSATVGTSLKYSRQDHIHPSDTSRAAASDLTTHTNDTTTMHGAVSTATANKLLIRDALGRAKVAAPSAEDDIALKSNVTTVQTNLTNHESDTSVHRQLQLLTNGGFEVWQRGAGPFTASGAYGPDRWQIELVGTDTLQVDREETIKKANSLYSAKLVYVYGNSGVTNFKQKLVISDGYHHLLGNVISLRLSVYATAANGVRAFIYTDGTGGTTTYSDYHVGDSAWANLDVINVTVPADATQIQVGVDFALVNVTVYLDNAIPVVGSVAADYMPLHPAEEMLRCQRYYEVHGGGSAYLIIRDSVNGAHSYGQWISFLVEKGGIPTMTKNGTWAVSNSEQPSTNGPNTIGYELIATASGAGAAYTYTDSTDDTIVAEWNPS